MIGEQIQMNSDGTATISCKIPAQWIPLLRIIAQSRGAVINDLLKLCVQFIIETAKLTTEPSPDMKVLLNMIKVDANWASMFNYCTRAELDIAQVILILQQSKDGKPRDGFGLAMYDKPFMGDCQQTLSKDLILNRVMELVMGTDDFKALARLGNKMDSGSIRETLSRMIDAQTVLDLDESDRDELPGYGTYHDYGRDIVYGQKHRRVPHRTPDSLANSQQTIHFDESDVPDLPELHESDGEQKGNSDDGFEYEGFRPFDVEP